jgi:hypothetical protein
MLPDALIIAVLIFAVGITSETFLPPMHNCLRDALFRCGDPVSMHVRRSVHLLPLADRFIQHYVQVPAATGWAAAITSKLATLVSRWHSAPAASAAPSNRPAEGPSLA